MPIATSSSVTAPRRFTIGFSEILNFAYDAFCSNKLQFMLTSLAMAVLSVGAMTADRRYHLTWQPWAVAAPALVIERAGVFGALGRSRELVRGNGWNVFGAIAIAIGIAIVASIIGTLVLFWLPDDLESFVRSLISNTGYPYISTYTLSRATAATAGVNLTRASQLVLLSNRGDERLDTVSLIDLRISRAFRFGTRRISPQLDIYNLTNQYTPQGLTVGVGSTYLRPTSIISPRIMRVGIVLNF